MAEALGPELGIAPLFVNGRDDYLVHTMALPVELGGYVSKPYQPEEILYALSVV